MEQVICRNCGSIEDYQKQQAGPHLKAICNGCGKYIKFLPQGNPPKLHFGKHKGKEIHTMVEKDEVDYLKWLTVQPGLKPKQKEVIDAHLSNL